MYKGIHIQSGYKNKIVIDDISFEIGSHQIAGIIGVNGSGKSTLLKSLAQVLKHQGNSTLDNECIEELSIHSLSKVMSYIPQNNGVSISLSVLDVVLMGYNSVLKMFDKPSVQQIQYARDVLIQMGLKDYIDEDYQKLSEGQKQLVMISRLIIEDTRILLLDEIDSALDFNHRYEMMKIIKELVLSSDKTVLMCLHDLSLALRFCDLLLIVDQGRCKYILYPKKDELEVLQDGLSSIYKNIKLIPYKHHNETVYLTHWEEL